MSLLSRAKAVRAFFEDVEADPDDTLYTRGLAALAEIERFLIEAEAQRHCLACDQHFILAPSEIEWFLTQRKPNGRPYDLPRRCLPCRQAGRFAPPSRRSKRNES